MTVMTEPAYCECRRKKFTESGFHAAQAEGRAWTCDRCGLPDRPRETDFSERHAGHDGTIPGVYYGTTPQNAEEAAREAVQRFPKDPSAQATFVKRVAFGTGAAGPGGGNVKQFANAMRRGMATLHEERTRPRKGVTVKVYRKDRPA